MLSTLESIDCELFIYLNGLHNSFFDILMFYASEKAFWIPFYLLIIVLLVRKFGIKALYIILPITLVILGTDQVSVFIKNEVARYRPCHNYELMQLVHKVDDHCGGKFGFISSHSSNAFGLFAYLTFMLNSNFRILKCVLFFWAVLLAYSRVYLGVHYPADVIGGAIVGVVISFIIVKVIEYFYKKYNINYE